MFTTSQPPKYGGGGAPCASCGKTVFVAERVAVGDSFYHTECFRCTTCNKKLGHDWSRDKNSGRLYCQHHFRLLSQNTGVIVHGPHSNGTGRRKSGRWRACRARCCCCCCVFVFGILIGIAAGTLGALEFVNYRLHRQPSLVKKLPAHGWELALWRPK